MDIKDNVIKLIGKLDEIRTGMLGADMVNLISKLNEANEYVNKIAKLSNDYKLNCAWQCLSEGKDVEKSINELYNYVSDSERAFFISNEFRKIILSSSVLASSVIALIMGKIVKANRKCTHQEAIILNAVGNMTDYDLMNFNVMMENAIDKLAGHEIINIYKLSKETRDSYRYTLNICANNGLFLIESDLVEEDGDGSLYMGLHYVVMDMSYALMEYIMEVRQLLNYQK